MVEHLLARPSVKCTANRFKLWPAFCLVLGFLGFGIDAKSSKLDYLRNELDSIKLKKQCTNDSLPSMIVFNLNYTLWPFTTEMIKPPIEKTNFLCFENAFVECDRPQPIIKHELKDETGERFKLFPEVHVVLEELNRKLYNLGALVDNSDFNTVNEISSLFGIKEYFNHTVSDPGTKTEQIQKLSDLAKVPLEEMLYFDSNQKSLKSVKLLNVTGIWVHPQVGFTYPHLEEGFRVFKYNFKIRNNLIVLTTLPPVPTRRRMPKR